MAVSDKHLKRAAENEREAAYICLFCTKEECTGATACFKEQKKLRQRQYQTDRRKAQQALDAFIMQNRQRKTVGAELKHRRLFRKGKKPNKFTCPPVGQT